MRPARSAICILLLITTAVLAHTNQQQILDSVDFKQHIGKQLPAGVRFTNADGKPVRLAGLAADQPLLLVMSWFDCPNLCPLLIDRLAAATGSLPFSSDDYRVAVVSIAPDEGPATARRLRTQIGQSHAGDMGNWYFLTGRKISIDKLARAVGFEYTYDSEHKRYAHPAGITVIAPGGYINSYLFGLNPERHDLRLALLEAGRGNLGNAVEHVLLRCYRFNPQTGQYDLAILNLLRVAGAGSAIMLAGLVFWLRRRERS